MGTRTTLYLVQMIANPLPEKKKKKKMGGGGGEGCLGSTRPGVSQVLFWCDVGCSMVYPYTEHLLEFERRRPVWRRAIPME